MPFPRRVGPTQLTTGTTTFYTPAQPERITFFGFTNVTAAIVTVRINVVPSGASVSSANAVAWDFPVGPNDFSVRKVDIPINAGDTVQASASANTAINLLAEVTDEKKAF